MIVKMNKIVKFFIASIVVLGVSCSEYLDVVPDNTMKLENVFSTKEDAYNALAKIYWYLPTFQWQHESYALMGDESVSTTAPTVINNTNNFRGHRIMRGLMNTNNPMLDTWSGGNGSRSLYQGIRNCNLFLEHIGATRHLTDAERADWIAQATFLKAYYHFMLMRKYGPIIISDKVIEPTALSDELFQHREKIDDVFDYILGLLNDEIIEALPEQRPESDYGMIDRVGALAIKAQILVYRASPFYTDPRNFYEDFLDPRDNQPYFNMTLTQDQVTGRWGEAVTALKTAISVAEGIGNKRLYMADEFRFLDDTTFFRLNPDKMQKLYDLRFIITDPWNQELLWGRPYPSISNSEIADGFGIRLPREHAGGSDLAERRPYSNQWLGASLQMAERYHSSNGLPIDQDRTYNYLGRNSVVTTPRKYLVDEITGVETAIVNPAYAEYSGMIQSNMPTAGLNLNREMRYYAHIGFTSGYYRFHYRTLPIDMMATMSGGFKTSDDNSNNFISTGIAVQKMSHPQSTSDHAWRVVRYPWPIIRLADLYLMLAEALNEYQGPSQEAFNAINHVRERAGLRGVEVVYTDPEFVMPTTWNPNVQRDLREIIFRERAIELAFEGHHFWDMWRHKRAHTSFSTPIYGWNYQGSTPSVFFVQTVVQQRRFLVRDYLWPISLGELNINGNLIQNPGWQ